MTTDPMTMATRFFGVPLLADPRKAAVLADAFGTRFLRAGDVPVRLIGDPVGQLPERGMGQRPQAAGIIGDEVARFISRAGGAYTNVGGVAVIPVVGTLVRRGAWIGQNASGVTSYEGVSAMLRAAAADPAVAAIALEVDSFGGEASGIFALMAEIRAVREAKPVRAFIADYALSAGYAVASQAGHVTVPPLGEAGSVGVIVVHAEMSRKLDQDGITVSIIRSGARKAEGNPYEPLPEAVREQVQVECDQHWAEFARQVETGRQGRIKVADILRLEARVLMGADAVKAGLADEVAEARPAFEAFVAEMNSDVPPVLPQGGGARAKTENVLPAGRAAGREGGETGAQALHIKETVMSNEAELPAVAETGPEQGKAQFADAGAAVAQERDRAARIIDKAAKAGLDGSFSSQLIAAGMSLEQAFEAILDAKAAKVQDGGDIVNVARTQVLADGRDRTRQGMTMALMARAGLDGGERNEFSSMTLKELARTSLVAQGATVPTGGSLMMAGAAFAPAMAGSMHSTSDFGNVLADVANKSMLKGYAEAAETFEQFTSTGTLSDFKPSKRVGIDAFPSLEAVAEGAEFTYGTFGDHAETVVVATYGRMFAITRQAIINDDLDAFTRVPMHMGRAARRTVGDLVFSTIAANAAMSDGTALFHADHGNLAGSGAGPSELTINAAITAMATQTDRSGNARLNISPKFLLAPPSWRSSVLQALNSEYAPDDTAKAGTAKQSNAYNTVRGAATPIFDARLTGTAWYMLADPMQFDTIEVAYLDGVTTPYLEQQKGWSIDGTEFKVRIDAGVKALAYQTMYKNAGG